MRRSLPPLLTLLLTLSVCRPAAAQNYDPVQVRTTALGKGVYMLAGAGGNMGLSVGDDAVFLVDDEFAPLTPKIRAAIAAQPAAEKGALPVVTFNDTVTFHINGDDVVAFHVAPAHTDGDAIVVFRGANVVHMGDVFVSAGFPFVDLSSGGSIHGVIAACARVLPVLNADTKVIPGHGPLTDRARVQAYHDMLVVMRDRMRKEIAAGHTIEQVLASAITAEYDKSWPGGRERFLRILFQELSRK